MAAVPGRSPRQCHHPHPVGIRSRPPSDPDLAQPPDPDLPEEPALLLPYMPEDGPCVIATQDTEGVNVRMLPGTNDWFYRDRRA